VKWLKDKAGLGVNDYKIDWKAKPEPALAAKAQQQIASLSVQKSLQVWGLGQAQVRVVGGVELAPVPIPAPAAPGGQLLERAFATGLETSVAQVVTADGNYRAAILPLTEASQTACRDLPVTVHEGVTYAGDAQRRVRQAFDNAGNAATFLYDADNRLRTVSFRTANNWEVQGTLTADGKRKLTVQSPRKDRLEYTFGPDKLLTDIALNGECQARLTWDKAAGNVEIKSLCYREEIPIGGLGAAPTRIENVAALERLHCAEGRAEYVREQSPVGDAAKAGKLAWKASADSLVVETPDGTTTYSRKPGAPNLIVEQGPGGRVEYECDPAGKRLKAVRRGPDEVWEYLPGTKRPDGATVLLHARKGNAEAEVAVAQDLLLVQEFDGTKTICRIKGDDVQVESSAPGKAARAVTYRYAGKRLASIERSDGPGVKFDWCEHINGRRLVMQVFNMR